MLKWSQSDSTCDEDLTAKTSGQKGRHGIVDQHGPSYLECVSISTRIGVERSI